jgi:hypothetical protein
MNIRVFLICQYNIRILGLGNVKNEEEKRLTSENTSKSLLAPSGLNLTTLAASLPLVELPRRGSPVTGSTSIGPDVAVGDDIISDENVGRVGR